MYSTADAKYFTLSRLFVSTLYFDFIGCCWHVPVWNPIPDMSWHAFFKHGVGDYRAEAAGGALSIGSLIGSCRDHRLWLILLSHGVPRPPRGAESLVYRGREMGGTCSSSFDTFNEHSVSRKYWASLSPGTQGDSIVGQIGNRIQPSRFSCYDRLRWMNSCTWPWLLWAVNIDLKPFQENRLVVLHEYTRGRLVT